MGRDPPSNSSRSSQREICFNPCWVLAGKNTKEGGCHGKADCLDSQRGDLPRHNLAGIYRDASPRLTFIDF